MRTIFWPVPRVEIPTKRGPVVRSIEFNRTLEPSVYRHIRFRFYRLHCQFISGNDKRAPYDYFMLVCGPVSARDQTLAPDGALSRIGEDGSLRNARAPSAGLPERAPQTFAL